MSVFFIALAELSSAGVRYTTILKAKHNKVSNIYDLREVANAYDWRLILNAVMDNDTWCNSFSPSRFSYSSIASIVYVYGWPWNR